MIGPGDKVRHTEKAKLISIPEVHGLLTVTDVYDYKCVDSDKRGRVAYYLGSNGRRYGSHVEELILVEEDEEMAMEEAIRSDNNRRLCRHRTQNAQLFLKQTGENLVGGDLTRASFTADRAAKEINLLLAFLEDWKTLVKEKDKA